MVQPILRGGHAFSEAIEGSKPITYKGFVVPEYWESTFYLVDNNGLPVTKTNIGSFKCWSVVLLIRTTQAETLEVIRTTINGAKSYKGHPVVSTFDPTTQHEKYEPVRTSFYKVLSDNRPLFLGHAITSLVQSAVYKKRKDKSHNWLLFQHNDIEEETLKTLAKTVINQAYVRKKDQSFYVEVSRLYEEAVSRGERPNLVLMQAYDKKLKTVQSWTTECRNRGLLAEPEEGKASQPKTTRKKGK